MWSINQKWARDQCSGTSLKPSSPEFTTSSTASEVPLLYSCHILVVPGTPHLSLTGLACAARCRPVLWNPIVLKKSGCSISRTPQESPAILLAWVTNTPPASEAMSLSKFSSEAAKGSQENAEWISGRGVKLGEKEVLKGLQAD